MLKNSFSFYLEKYVIFERLRAFEAISPVSFSFAEFLIVYFQSSIVRLLGSKLLMIPLDLFLLHFHPPPLRYLRRLPKATLNQSAEEDET